jgi:hypothetical protein
VTRQPLAAGGTGVAPHRIRYSKVHAAITLAVQLALGGQLGWLALAALLSGHLALVMAGVIALAGLVVFVVPYVPETVRALRGDEPVVTFDADGVRDVRNEPPAVAWEDVSSIDLGLRRSTHHLLIFTLRDTSPVRGREGRAQRLGRTLAGHGDWHVNLRRLRCGRQQALETARRFHREAIRRRVVATGGGPDRGWSGRL